MKYIGILCGAIIGFFIVNYGVNGNIFITPETSQTRYIQVVVMVGSGAIGHFIYWSLKK